MTSFTILALGILPTLVFAKGGKGGGHVSSGHGSGGSSSSWTLGPIETAIFVCSIIFGVFSLYQLSPAIRHLSQPRVPIVPKAPAGFITGSALTLITYYSLMCAFLFAKQYDLYLVTVAFEGIIIALVVGVVVAALRGSPQAAAVEIAPIPMYGGYQPPMVDNTSYPLMGGHAQSYYQPQQGYQPQDAHFPQYDPYKPPYQASYHSSQPTGGSFTQTPEVVRPPRSFKIFYILALVCGGLAGAFSILDAILTSLLVHAMEISFDAPGAASVLCNLSTVLASIMLFIAAMTRRKSSRDDPYASKTTKFTLTVFAPLLFGWGMTELVLNILTGFVEVRRMVMIELTAGSVVLASVICMGVSTFIIFYLILRVHGQLAPLPKKEKK
ncbi:hypothetical protein DL96DRAFT_1675908 [Flagelloscypha sp. PMI_526]|nr:hypothetical protein DL96DRAFT_1675908 [Flagelloscypha sp. PMI_526]